MVAQAESWVTSVPSVRMTRAFHAARVAVSGVVVRRTVTDTASPRVAEPSSGVFGRPESSLRSAPGQSVFPIAPLMLSVPFAVRGPGATTCVERSAVPGPARPSPNYR